jgi:hypothetical protein
VILNFVPFKTFKLFNDFRKPFQSFQSFHREGKGILIDADNYRLNLRPERKLRHAFKVFDFRRFDQEQTHSPKALRRFPDLERFAESAISLEKR